MTKETNQWEKLNLEKFIFSEINFNKLDNLNKKNPNYKNDDKNFWKKLITHLDDYIISSWKKIEQSCFKKLFVEQKLGRLQFQNYNQMKTEYQKIDGFYGKIKNLNTDLWFKKSNEPWGFEANYSNVLKLFKKILKDFFENEAGFHDCDLSLDLEEFEFKQNQINKIKDKYEKIFDDSVDFYLEVELLNSLVKKESKKNLEIKAAQLINKIQNKIKKIKNLIKEMGVDEEIIQIQTQVELAEAYERKEKDLSKFLVGTVAQKEQIYDTLLELKVWLSVINELISEELQEQTLFYYYNNFALSMNLLDQIFWITVFHFYIINEIGNQIFKEIFNLEYPSELNYQRESLFLTSYDNGKIINFWYKHSDIVLPNIKGKYKIDINIEVISKNNFNLKKYKIKQDYLVAFDFVDLDDSFNFVFEIYDKNKQLIFEHKHKE